LATVTLLAYTPQPEKTIAAAAKLCYASDGVQGIMEGLTPEKTASFVEMLAEIGHESPIEHASFTFGIEGVSRAFLAQVTRHRIASYSVQSQRYVKKDGFAYITPPEIAAEPDALKLYEQAMQQANEAYQKLSEQLAKKHFEKMLASGMDEKSARRAAEKKAIEDARFVLPNACDTKMVMTINARSLMNFFRHRCCNRAQWEIREVAEQMFSLVYAVAPNLFKNAGPACLYGPCPEGKMSCKMAPQMRQKYQELKENGLQKNG